MDSAAYRVVAYNTAKESENRIHDDGIARRFGFSGGLVLGVDVYAYMTHLPIVRWGRAWLERGTAECRFAQPVYDGEAASVTAAAGPGGMTLAVESGGRACAAGTAALPDRPPAFDPAAWPDPPAPPAERPPADAASLAEGRWLGIRPIEVTAAFAARYCADVRETDPIYAREGLVHPGLILRLGNWALTQNVVLGPWIHVGSRIANLAAGRVGEHLAIRARVARNYAHKGHLFVELDALAVALDGAGRMRPLALIAHTAIYRPRQVAAA